MRLCCAPPQPSRRFSRGQTLAHRSTRKPRLYPDQMMRLGGAAMTEAFESLETAERLLEVAEDNPPEGRQAAISALRALILEWALEPRADTVEGLLEQAAETDDTLLEFRAEASVLDRYPDEPDSAERAKIFVDAVRG